MNQLADFLVWMQIEEPNMPLDRNEREGYFYHDIVEKMWKAWKVSHMHWTPLTGRISPEKKRSFKEDDFPDTLVDRLKGVSTSAMGAQKPSKIELEAAREIERLRAERDGLKAEVGRRKAEGEALLQKYMHLVDEKDELKVQNHRLRKAIPKTPEAVISLIRSNFNSMRPVNSDGKPKGNLEHVTYVLTVHDLLSAFDDLTHSMSALPDTKGE